MKIIKLVVDMLTPQKRNRTIKDRSEESNLFLSVNGMENVEYERYRRLTIRRIRCSNKEDPQS